MGLAQAVFTRARKILVELITKEADESEISVARGNMIEAFKKLEEANTKFLIAANSSVEKLNLPGQIIFWS